jgi:hypothetical protein
MGRAKSASASWTLHGLLCLPKFKIGGQRDDQANDSSNDGYYIDS